MSAHSNPVVLLEGVSKIFYADEVETHALSRVHLQIRHGEFVSVAGPSGCGKSTLLSIVGLLDSPTEGGYTINGKPVASLSISERSRIRNREIGFVFQAFNLIGDLTVFENVELPLTYRGMTASERRRRVQEVLDRVGMAHRMKHYPAQLSGGQQQRVAVARALGGQPSILLADEPTGNLDSKNSEAVMDLLKELHKEGATLCVVTHDPRYSGISISSTAVSSKKQWPPQPRSCKSILKKHASLAARGFHQNVSPWLATRFSFFEHGAVLDCTRGARDHELNSHLGGHSTWNSIPRRSSPRGAKCCELLLP